MRCLVGFRSWLAPHLRAFVALKRATGCDYRSQERILRGFDRHVHRQVRASLSASGLADYLKTKDHLAPRSRDNVVAVLWQALAHAKRHGAQVTAPPLHPPKPTIRVDRHQPRILTEAELGALLSAATHLSPKGSYRPITTMTIIGLLWATGLRIGEALALDTGDFDARERLLTVREGKFGKARILALRDSTAAALDRYLHHPLRQETRCSTAPLFISLRRKRLCVDSFHHNFVAAWTEAALPGPRPRVHDLRHAFAVRRVAQWYEAGEDVNSKLPALSTYLGHVSVENTRLYLVANGALLQAASVRFEQGVLALDGAQP